MANPHDQRGGSAANRVSIGFQGSLVVAFLAPGGTEAAVFRVCGAVSTAEPDVAPAAPGTDTGVGVPAARLLSFS